MQGELRHPRSRAHQLAIAFTEIGSEEEPQEKSRLWDIQRQLKFKMSGRGGGRQEMAESYNTLKTQGI